jgi:hypothetical protein
MKPAAILLAALSLAAAGAASATERMSDMDYLKANRCLGIAAGLNAADTAGLNALLKAQGRSRSEPILLRGQDELGRAKRDAERASYKEQLTAELNGPCMAYMGGAEGGGSGSKVTASAH